MTYLLQKAESENWRNRFSESKRTVKDCTNKANKSSLVGTLKDNNNNIEISNDIDKADFINFFTTSVEEDLSQKHYIPDDFEMLNHIDRISPTIQSTGINFSQVVKDLENVKANRAPGPDGISSRALSLIKSSATDGLFTGFHKSSCLNQFPDIWKQAKFIPVLNKGSFSEVSNYRPISLLSIPGKLLENQFLFYYRHSFTRLWTSK